MCNLGYSQNLTCFKKAEKSFSFLLLSTHSNKYKTGSSEISWFISRHILKYGTLNRLHPTKCNCYPSPNKWIQPKPIVSNSNHLNPIQQKPVKTSNSIQPCHTKSKPTIQSQPYSTQTSHFQPISPFQTNLLNFDQSHSTHLKPTLSRHLGFQKTLPR